MRTMNPQKRREIFERFRAANPHPTTELEYETPFELLVAVILSAQATDKSVNAATRKLFPVARTPRGDCEARRRRPREIHPHDWPVESQGEERDRDSVWRSADEHGGEVPRTREALEELPGVGRKTANVVLNTIFGEPTIAVDTHIFRVANRTRIAPGETPREVEDALVKFTPGEFAHDAHHWLILHGRYVCKALKPECARCLVNDLCEYPLRRKIIAAAEESSVIFAGQSRDQLRETYRAAWRKYKQQHTLSPLDKQVVAVISEHPEYHVIVESAAADLANYSPRSGQLNPWLHMGLHLAIREQVATNRPPALPKCTRSSRKRRRRARSRAPHAGSAGRAALGSAARAARRRTKTPTWSDCRGLA